MTGVTKARTVMKRRTEGRVAKAICSRSLAALLSTNSAVGFSRPNPRRMLTSILPASKVAACADCVGVRGSLIGLVEDVTSRDGIIASMRDVVLKQFLFLRNLSAPLIDRFGPSAGFQLLDEAFRQYTDDAIFDRQRP
jgi:hypothetical protein